MRGCLSWRATALASVLLALGLWGCAESASLPDAPRLPSQQDRAQFGTIGVTAARFAPQDVSLTGAVIGKDAGAAKGAGAGAAYGAFYGAMEGLLLSIEEGGFIGAFLIPLTVPAGAAIGATVGAAGGATKGGERAIGKDAAEQVQTCVGAVLLNPEIQRSVRKRVLAVAIGETSYPVVAIDEEGPIAPEQAVDYQSLENRDIDTVLEVSIVNAGLAGGLGDQVYVQPFLLAEVRVVRVADNTEVFRRSGWYSLEYRPLYEWCVDEGRALRAALDRVFTTMAEAIVEEVFLIWQPSSED